MASSDAKALFIEKVKALQDLLVEDHNVHSLSPREKMNFVKLIGDSFRWAVALQIVEPNSWMAWVVSWLGWANSRIYYLPNLMALSSEEMSPRSNNMLVMCWLLTGDKKYVVRLVKSLDPSAPLMAKASCVMLIESLSKQYRSFANILNEMGIYPDDTPPLYQEKLPSYTEATRTQLTDDHVEDCRRRPNHNTQQDQTDNQES